MSLSCRGRQDIMLCLGSGNDGGLAFPPGALAAEKLPCDVFVALSLFLSFGTFVSLSCFSWFNCVMTFQFVSFSLSELVVKKRGSGAKYCWFLACPELLLEVPGKGCRNFLHLVNSQSSVLSQGSGSVFSLSWKPLKIVS